MCVIYILTLFLIHFLFLNIYDNYYAKFIVISKNENNILKIHTKKPIHLFKAIKIKKQLKKQYYHMTLSGFRINKEVLILKIINH